MLQHIKFCSVYYVLSSSCNAEIIHVMNLFHHNSIRLYIPDHFLHFQTFLSLLPQKPHLDYLERLCYIDQCRSSRHVYPFGALFLNEQWRGGVVASALGFPSNVRFEDDCSRLVSPLHCVIFLHTKHSSAMYKLVSGNPNGELLKCLRITQRWPCISCTVIE